MSYYHTSSFYTEYVCILRAYEIKYYYQTPLSPDATVCHTQNCQNYILL